MSCIFSHFLGLSGCFKDTPLNLKQLSDGLSEVVVGASVSTSRLKPCPSCPMVDSRKHGGSGRSERREGGLKMVGMVFGSSRRF